MSARRLLRASLSFVLLLIGLVFLAACVPLIAWVGQTVGSSGVQQTEVQKSTAQPISAYDMYVNNLTSRALEGLMTVPKVYWLAEDAVVAPKPNPDNFGSSSDPADTAALLARADGLFDLSNSIWTPETPLFPYSQVHWYLDDSILSLTWKQVFQYTCFSFSEVWIAHPSQFKRYLADNSFSSPIQYPPTEMAAAVNAVTAMSADFYKHRTFGTVVYQRQLYRVEGEYLDVCYVDTAGDLIMVPRGTLTTEEQTQRFIEENDILFSLCFGPIMIHDGEIVVPDSYLIGEINDIYARCCICQLGPCHYLLVTVNAETPYENYLTVRQVAEVLHSLGVEKAYTLDGGQTAAMYADGQLINSVEFGNQRSVSDIIYFATAVPEEGAG